MVRQHVEEFGSVGGRISLALLARPDAGHVGSHFGSLACFLAFGESLTWLSGFEFKIFARLD